MRAAASDDPTLPPLFTPMAFAADADLPQEALFRARRGRIAPGTVCFSERPDRLDAILMLAPETALSHAIQVIYPLMLAANDSLGATIPPGVAVHLGWPDRIFVNGALAGGMALYTEAADPDAVPDWMLARLTIDVMGNPQNPVPGKEKERTSLYEEGAGDLSAKALLESFTRYFLNWLDRWQRGGIPAIKPLWLERAAGREEETAFPDGDGLTRGILRDITDDGDLIVMARGGKPRALKLSGLLAGPSWEI